MFEVILESLEGLTQKQLCFQVDQAHQRCHANLTQAAGEREVARMASLSLAFAGSWLNCTPIPALGLHMRSNEFVAATKFRQGNRDACLQPRRGMCFLRRQQ